MNNVIQTKSYAFAIRIVNAYKFLTNDQKEYVLSKQMLRSGTAIGALVAEAHHAQSSADFLNKMNVALKEACLLYTSPSPRDAHESRMPSSA